jgi:hypothetical protein
VKAIAVKFLEKEGDLPSGEVTVAVVEVAGVGPRTGIRVAPF